VRVVRFLLRLTLWVRKYGKYNLGISFVNIRSYGLHVGKCIYNIRALFDVGNEIFVSCLFK